MKKTKDIFETSELALVAALKLYGYKIHNTTRDNNKTFFQLEEDVDLNRYVLKFWNHGLSVDPLAYFQAMKEIKSMIYNLDLNKKS